MPAVHLSEEEIAAAGVVQGMANYHEHLRPLLVERGVPEHLLYPGSIHVIAYRDGVRGGTNFVWNEHVDADEFHPYGFSDISDNR